ncbi:H-NS histone family protein [Comamonas sp.]|uniref:H-NS histone family protein n=1 Tax=Comamonas sp. TaxID=34028 RepID=UPI00258C9847|nr:H-NS histone family protein [Comamonas sp.]
MSTLTPSYKELLAQRTQLEQKIAEARSTEIAGALSRIHTLISEYGLSAEDIFPAKKQRATSSSVVQPKYRDPATGQTWTGRGKAPLWIKDKDRTQFEIK